MTLRWGRARKQDDFGFHLARNFRNCAWTGLFVKGGVQSLLTIAAADIEDGGGRTQQGGGDCRIRTMSVLTVIGEQKDTRPRLDTGGGIAFCDELLEVGALRFRKVNTSMLCHVTRIPQDINLLTN